MKKLLLICGLILGCIACDAATDNTEMSTDSSATFIRCETNFDCPESMPFCADNRCVACKADADCPLGALCRAGECIPCNTDEHCGESCGACPELDPYCNDAGTACGICNELHPCDTGEVCIDGACELCNTAEHCGADCTTCEGFNPYCNDAGEACSECNTEHPCDPGEWCDNRTCTICDNADHCGIGCEVCTGTSSPVCSLDGDRCVECNSRLDCGGKPAVCTPDKTCTCEKVNSGDPKLSCTNDSQCPHADFVCAQDWASPSHYTCMHTCAAETTYDEGLACQSLPTVDGGDALVWAPHTTCHAHYQYQTKAACSPSNEETVCSGLASGFDDAICNNDSKCSYGCENQFHCSPAGRYCCYSVCTTVIDPPCF